MTFRRWQAAVLATLLVAASVHVSLGATTAASRFDGRPSFGEGRALGYFVWREGETWKVRWTTFRAEHRFSGRVVVESGELFDLKRVDVDRERKTIAPGRPARVVRGARGRIRSASPGPGVVVQATDDDHLVQESEHLVRFSAVTDDDIDGFDFRMRGGVRELRLLLEIDGVPRPAEIEVGKDNVRLAETPVVVALP